MNIGDTHYRTIWVKRDDPRTVRIINQQLLPHRFEVMDLRTVEETATAIGDMYVRGAGLIGAAAGFGMYLAAITAPDAPAAFTAAVYDAARALTATRPTAKNLEWAVLRQLAAMALPVPKRPAGKGGAAAGEADSGGRTGRTAAEVFAELETPAPPDGFSVAAARAAAFEEAGAIADEDADFCRRIGEHGLPIIRGIAESKPGGVVHILTHCNAGWLAFVDYGSATAPIYAAYDAGIAVHVWVDETRPRNQGASLTAWELANHGVPCDVIADNAGGHLMQHGMVDLVITGTDRTTVSGDVANKIGTYLKALAAKDNGVPFYVALPSSTFDWDIRDGVREIPIEERDPDEVRYIQGRDDEGRIGRVLLTPERVDARNFAFDVTPARLISGLITERGLCAASEEAVLELFPEHRGR
jgi:methylthioribose-1-phosphate isomerase